MDANQDHLRLSSLRIRQVKKRMYIEDPEYVPPSLRDKNVIEINEPFQVTAITTDGRELPVILENHDAQIQWMQETVGPD